jgi:hypothetical protein
MSKILRQALEPSFDRLWNFPSLRVSVEMEKIVLCVWAFQGVRPLTAHMC